MIFKTTVRPDRFKRIISGEKKEYRIPFQHIKLGHKKYDMVKFCSAFGVWALVELLGVDEDWKTAEYVFKLGCLKSSAVAGTNTPREFADFAAGTNKSRKKYIHKCEVFRDGQKIGILNLSTKQGQKQRRQLGRLLGYSFNELPLEIITI